MTVRRRGSACTRSTSLREHQADDDEVEDRGEADDERDDAVVGTRPPDPGGSPRPRR